MKIFQKTSFKSRKKIIYSAAWSESTISHSLHCKYLHWVSIRSKSTFKSHKRFSENESAKVFSRVGVFSSPKGANTRTFLPANFTYVITRLLTAAIDRIFIVFCRHDEMSTAWAKSSDSVELSRVDNEEEPPEQAQNKPQNWLQQGLARINTKRIKRYGACSESMEDDSKSFLHQVS